jgi:hypothetical protein
MLRARADMKVQYHAAGGCSRFAASCWRVTVLRVKGLLTVVVMSRNVFGVSPEKLSWSMAIGLAYTR